MMDNNNNNNNDNNTSFAFASTRPGSSPSSSFSGQATGGRRERSEGRLRSASIPPPPAPSRGSNTPSRTPLQLAPLHQQTMVTTRPPSNPISPRNNISPQEKGSERRKNSHRWPKAPYNPAFYFEYWLAQNTAEKKALLSLQSRPEEFKENFFEVWYNWISFGKAALGGWNREDRVEMLYVFVDRHSDIFYFYQEHPSIQPFIHPLTPCCNLLHTISSTF